MFTLRNKETGKLVLFSVESNGDCENCNDVRYSLENRHSEKDHYWIVESREQAEYVRDTSSEWYNASYTYPAHDFVPSEWEVVEVSIKVR